ncbi:hypothetical protein COY27_06050 [Candidatus Woesearchaeota archaeon CG_4_10_14_0_2_um_filter_33_13]|nr:MAG: hypothetical protein COY27_06050 [Candidatus Woesearchaeota archaeon CG_4_10_14_0_2_um_filter_33_13]
MVVPKFKQKCAMCKTNWVEMFSRKQFPICSKCQMKKLNKPIEDPKFKKMFDLPTELYEKSSFLRNIKEAYLRFGNLTEKQIEAFKKTVKDLKENKEPGTAKPTKAVKED